MPAEQRVYLFTASGTFRGARGLVKKREPHRVLVLPEGEPFPMWFVPGEVVSADDSGQHVVAGD